MTRHLRLSKSLLVSVFLFLISDSKLLRLPAQTSSATNLLICESINDACNRPDARLDIAWTFDGTDGRVSSPINQAGTHLTIEKFDSGSIVIRRVDQSGPTAGLTALYTGTINSTRINGVVQWSWPNHPEYPAHGVFSGTLQNHNAAVSDTGAPVSPTIGSINAPPAELLVCENAGPCNAAWTFKGTTGTGIWYARNPTRATLTLVRFEPNYILIRRTDTTDGVSATYAGSPRGDHYSGTIVWSSLGHPGQSTGAWTATVPQTNCTVYPDLEAADALRIGQYALMFKRDDDALSCYIVAAKSGDATAQAAVGLLYYQGRGGVAQDYKEAFLWLRKAADQGVYAAQRTVAEMYSAGQGTNRDPTSAAIYTARADEQKHDMERRQDFEERAQARREEHADRTADRMNRLLSSFVLGASFGLFF